MICVVADHAYLGRDKTTDHKATNSLSHPIGVDTNRYVTHEIPIIF